MPLLSEHFQFELSHANDEWILRRNWNVVTLKPGYASNLGEWHLFVEWTPELLRLSKGTLYSRQVQTAYTVAPPELRVGLGKLIYKE